MSYKSLIPPSSGLKNLFWMGIPLSLEYLIPTTRVSSRTPRHQAHDLFPIHKVCIEKKL